MSGLLIGCMDPRMKRAAGEVSDFLELPDSYYTATPGAALKIEIAYPFIEDVVENFGTEAIDHLAVANHLNCKRCAAIYGQLSREDEAKRHEEALLQGLLSLRAEFDFFKRVGLFLITGVEATRFLIQPPSVRLIHDQVFN